MRLALAAIALLVLAVLPGHAAAADFTPTVEWAAAVGETDADTDEIDGIAVDPSHNTIVSGVFRNEVRFGGTTFHSHGQGDVFLASFDPDGTVRWAKQFGGTGDDNTFDLKADGAGNAYASGWFTGTVDFGGVTLTSRGATDMFLAKFDSSGRTIWARSYGGEDGDGGNELDVLPNGEIVVAAITDGDFRIGDVAYPSGGGTRDSYALRVDRDGKLLWVTPFADPGAQRIRAIDINEAGGVWVGFQYRGNVSAAGKTLTSVGDWDGAVARLTPQGQPLWLLPVGSPGEDNVRGLASGPDGTVYASGTFVGPAYLIDREFPAVGAMGDDYLTRLSPEGTPEWTITFGGPGPGTGGEVRSDRHGVMTTSVASTDLFLQRDLGEATTLRLPSGLPTSYLAAFTPEGNLRFSYMPEPIGAGSRAIGDILGISPDGRYVAESPLFRGTLKAGDTLLSTPSESDAAIIFLRTDVPDPPPSARARIVAAPRSLRLRQGKRRAFVVKIRNSGGQTARKVRLCPRPARAAIRRLRLSRCVTLGSIRPGQVRKARIRVTARRGRQARGPARIRLRLGSANAGRDQRAVKVRVLPRR